MKPTTAGAVRRAATLLVLLLLGTVLTAAAQYTPPDITFVPEERTFYGANQQVQVHICDDESVREAATRVWLNGTLVAASSVAGDASCAVHRVVTLNLALSPGSNTLLVKACENLLAESCTTNEAVYVYAATDPVKPTGVVSPPGGTFATPTVPVEVAWCDDYRLNTASPQLFLNGTAVQATTTAAAGSSSCHAAAISTATLTLQPGANAFKAVVRDSAGNVSDTLRFTFTHAQPTAGAVILKVGEDRVRRPGLCAAACFDATLQYSSHTLTSMDAARAVTLAYSSAHAEPRGMVQLDVDVETGPVPTRIGLTLYNAGGAAVPLFGTTQTSAWYTGAAGANRVSAWFDASLLATGTYRYRAEVTRVYGTSVQTDTLGVRVIVVNETGSPYGAGWSIAQDVKLVPPGAGMDSGGVTIQRPAWRSGAVSLDSYAHLERRANCRT
ncbi:MAG TPA: hypothetical protein VFJ16_05060 [Longimicrobium sp.]|nr:hypothetical protein [Longimicrobium sp.]